MGRVLARVIGARVEEGAGRDAAGQTRDDDEPDDDEDAREGAGRIQSHVPMLPDGAALRKGRRSRAEGAGQPCGGATPVATVWRVPGPNEPRDTVFLVVSDDPERRERWARLFESERTRALRCAGPRVSCALLSGQTCPLLGQADAALYDLDSVIPAFMRLLPRHRRLPPLFLARDGITPDGRRGPMDVRRYQSLGPVCFGTL